MFKMLIPSLTYFHPTLLLITMVILSPPPSTSFPVPLDSWRFPCTGGRNDSVLLSGDEMEKARELEEQVRQSFNFNQAFEEIAGEVKSLKEEIIILMDNYFASRFPGEDKDTYKDVSYLVLPQVVGSSTNDELMLEEASDNLARFSVYLKFAVLGEMREKFMEHKFIEDYDNIHNNSDHGVNSILCKIFTLMTIFRYDLMLTNKLENFKMESMTSYLESKSSKRHMKDFLIMRQFMENLDHIWKNFKLRSLTYSSPEQLVMQDVNERSERHAPVDQIKMDDREEISDFQLESLEKVLKSKREKLKPKHRKGRSSSRRFQRDQKEFDVLMQMI